MRRRPWTTRAFQRPGVERRRFNAGARTADSRAQRTVGPVSLPARDLKRQHPRKRPAWRAVFRSGTRLASRPLPVTNARASATGSRCDGSVARSARRAVGAASATTTATRAARAPAATEAAATTATAAPSALLVCLVDDQGTPFHREAVQGSDRCLRAFGRTHRDEGKTARTSGFTVCDDPSVSHVSMSRKKLRQLSIGDAPGQIAYVDLGHARCLEHRGKNRCRRAHSRAGDRTGRRMEDVFATLSKHLPCMVGAADAIEFVVTWGASRPGTAITRADSMRRGLEQDGSGESAVRLSTGKTGSGGPEGARAEEGQVL